MKKIKVIGVIIFVFLFHIPGGANIGCKLPDGKIHSPKTGTALLGARLFPLNLGLLVNLYNSPAVGTTSSTCPNWADNVVASTTPCATAAISVLGLGVVADNQGVEVSFTLVECALDDYTWGLGLTVMIMGIIAIRNKIAMPLP